MERRLAAVLAADVVGYSRLVREDEAGTLVTLKAHREDLLEPKIAERRGRIVKLTGDGLLAEFPSAVEAVQCAVEMQHLLGARDRDRPEEERIAYRIGINIGDIVVEDNDIYGDGVNVAARLEGLAEPGGICVARNVFDQVKDKLDLTIELLGERAVKNIAEPVTTYRVVLDDKAAALVTPVVKLAARPGPRWRTVGAVAAAAIALVGGGALWWFSSAPDVEPASIARMAFPLPSRPSIAVLPFSNLSDDPSQEYFADGMTDDLITDLSNISGLFVIARNSAFAYKGKAVEVHQVAEELGVRYVLEGSVRRAGDRVRINAQLVDAVTGGYLWAERYDGPLADVFSLQDRVTHKIVTALAVNLTAGEQARRAAMETDSSAAYDAFLRGWTRYRRRTPDDFAEAVSHLERAIELDPDYSRAYAALAAIHWSIIDENWATGTSAWSRRLGISTDQSLELEKRYLEAALKDPVALAHQVASGRLSRQGQHEAAIAEAGRAIKLNPNDPIGYEAMTAALVYAGRPAEAVAHIEQAMRLDPWFPQQYFYWQGLAEFGMERFESAVEALVKATENNPDDDRSLLVLAAAYGHLGRGDEARAAVERANRLRRERQRSLDDATAEAGVTALLVGPYTLQDVDLWALGASADRERLSAGLRLAGLPEAGGGGEVSPISVPGATTVDVAAAKALFDRGVTFIDVRGEGSWNNGHIPRAVHLSFKENFGEAALSAALARDQEAVVYCMGPRCLLSSKACAQAVAWGFEKIYYFREGFPAWKAAGHPVAVP